MALVIGCVCRNKRPVAARWLYSASGTPSWMLSSEGLTISSRKRVTWRALRATSVMPFLLWSSSSRIAIGK